MITSPTVTLFHFDFNKKTNTIQEYNENQSEIVWKNDLLNIFATFHFKFQIRDDNEAVLSIWIPYADFSFFFVFHAFSEKILPFLHQYSTYKIRQSGCINHKIIATPQGERITQLFEWNVIRWQFQHFKIYMCHVHMCVCLCQCVGVMFESSKHQNIITSSASVVGNNIYSYNAMVSNEALPKFASDVLNDFLFWHSMNGNNKRPNNRIERIHCQNPCFLLESTRLRFYYLNAEMQKRELFRLNLRFTHSV